MPANTNVQNATAIMDAIADFYDKTPTTQQKADIIEEFINEIGGGASNEEKAATFISMLKGIIVSTGTAHVGIAQEQVNEASVQAARDGASSNNL